MFFSKEADKFLNAGSSRKSMGHDVRAHHAEGSSVEGHKRRYREDGGDVPESHKKGCSVGRRYHEEGSDVKAEAHKRGKRVHARSRHADVNTVDAMPPASDAAAATKTMRRGGRR